MRAMSPRFGEGVRLDPLKGTDRGEMPKMSIRVRIFSDFSCPFCYLGAGIMEELKREFDLSEEWVGYELHPETPEDGVLLTERFPDYDFDEFFEELRIKGSRYGCEFGSVTLLSNSRKALEAGEFARDHGKHHAFHALVFRAYFSEGRDIGQIHVILDVAAQVGLDIDELLKALTERRYAERLEKGRLDGNLYDVRVLPTFIFDGRERIVGMRSIEAFRALIQGLSCKSLNANL
jgi:predicted DsbA family dithiol-disulfide isomerase